MGNDCIVDESCSIPKTEDEITAEWISKHVGIAPLPNSISVVGNIQAGVGFLSNLCRVSFQTQEGAKQNILVKLLPVSPEYRALTLSEKFDEREIQFYSIVQPKIVEIAPDIAENLCQVYCGKTSKVASGNADDENYASMLVMEDLKPKGYQMLNLESEQLQVNLENVIKFLAKFHCAGFRLEESSKRKISELFPFCMGVGESKIDTLLELGQANAKRLDAFLEENNCSPEIRSAYKEVSDQVEKCFVQALIEASKNPCLIHGDIWPPNIMATESGNLPVKIIDWQLLGYRDPTVELTVAILSCLPIAQLKRETIDKLCQLYLDTCEALGTNLGRSRAEFKEFFNTWGMVYAYFWFLLSFDSFPDDTKRLFRIFEFLQSEYKVSQLMQRSS